MEVGKSGRVRVGRKVREGQWEEKGQGWLVEVGKSEGWGGGSGWNSRNRES